MTQGESPTFTDMGMGDCQYNGTFMPCSMAYIFEGYDSPYMGDWGTFFSKRHRLPFEADGKYRYAKNNPMYIANDILRQNRTNPPRGLGDPERPERELYEAGYLSFLLGSGPPPRHKPWYIVGFNNSQRKTIDDQVRSMYGNEACDKAFEAAGLESLTTMMNKGSLVFVYDGLLLDSGNDSSWLGDSYLRSRFLDLFSPSLTVRGAAHRGPYKGNYYISLRRTAFTNTGDTAINIIIHELIHAGGARHDMNPISVPTYEVRGGNYSPVRVIRKGNQMVKPKHDLEWLNFENGEYVGHYDKIIKACQPPKK
ncbi:MAG: hypothetical protein KF881_07555 [Acidobacteria bacterium]|nr:hypothetical protein [Acidobacteriota bacterium]